MPRPVRYLARSPMPVPAAELFAWHARPGAFERLNPPFAPVEVLERSGGIEVGARTVIRMHMGPVPLKWEALHTAYEAGTMFQDTQLSGPFSHWVHTHRAVPNGMTSLLEDEVEYALPLGLLGSAFGGHTARHQLESMFAYRHAVTSGDLARHARFAGKGPLRIAITGASGFVGSALVPFLTTGGHTVLKLVRRASGENDIAWDPKGGTVEQEKLEGVDAVIHLAGAGVADGRWTEERKKEIHDSREQGTRTLAGALAKLQRRPRVFISASAVGFYGDTGDAEVDEAAPPADDFLARVCVAWERETAPAEAAGIRTVKPRVGVVLSPAGGALHKMLPPFKLGGGGPQGSGQQWMSWIHLDDLVGLLHHALFDEEMSGPVNAVSPGALRNADFAHTLGHVLGRPAVVPLPALAIRAAFGEMGEAVLLAGQRVRPAKAQAAGFTFLYPQLEGALRMLLGKERLGSA
ncbi:MAG: TIGR01777 family oxidoreductase [Deltaproteobacteria bacterium]|nr:TIGR01777 family oxidoreductase [Deltaproteobacteria bacterium]